MAVYLCWSRSKRLRSPLQSIKISIGATQHKPFTKQRPSEMLLSAPRSLSTEHGSLTERLADGLTDVISAKHRLLFLPLHTPESTVCTASVQDYSHPLMLTLRTVERSRWRRISISQPVLVRQRHFPEDSILHTHITSKTEGRLEKQKVGEIEHSPRTPTPKMPDDVAEIVVGGRWQQRAESSSRWPNEERRNDS